MMKIPKLKIKKIKQFLKKLPRTLGEKSFLTFLGLLLIALIFSGLIFYKYSFLAEKGKLEVLEKPLKFNEKVYQVVLKIWQEKEKKFEETNFKKYPDPFRGIKIESPESTLAPEVEEGELEEELIPEMPLTELEIKELQATTNLYEFYRIKGEKLPSITERAKIWEEKGLGTEEEYIGSFYQNQKLLTELKKELTK